MKKIVIVEDRPWVTEKAVLEMRDKNIEVAAMVYYPNSNSTREKQEEKVKEFYAHTKVKVKWVSNQKEFEDVMDEWYKDEQVVFLVDFDLKGDGSTNFDTRINVRYAKKQEKQEQGNKRFWFYTTGNVDVKNILATQFKNHVIDVLEFLDMQVEWDMEQIERMVGV